QGTTIVHLYYNHFKVMKIDVPKVEEQQKIASFLVTIDNSIQTLGEQIEESRLFKKGLLQKMFV
ncbi:MAG: restriction endonuclease subunit S, partial [Psychroflexus sp.]|nr:restriction endonuclease subunit S [Psychroflexus sp.]